MGNWKFQAWEVNLKWKNGLFEILMLYLNNTRGILLSWQCQGRRLKIRFEFKNVVQIISMEAVWNSTCIKRSEDFLPIQTTKMFPTKKLPFCRIFRCLFWVINSIIWLSSRIFSRNLKKIYISPKTSNNVAAWNKYCLTK